MRELILDDIETFRSQEQNFDKATMRWSHWWLSTRRGIVLIYSRKDKGKYNDLVRFEDTNREDFDRMDNAKLLAAYQLIIRQMSKQM